MSAAPRPPHARAERPLSASALPVTTFSLDLLPEVRTWVTGWGTALRRATKVAVQTLKLQSATPKVISVRIPPTRVSAHSYVFPELPGWSQPQTHRGNPAAVSEAAARPPAAQGTGHTRFHPPRDIIKLQDRLYYVLQPPLETLVSSGQISFSFQPFPYQYQGVAFLYPRYAAILADEMGLGKSMQAITSARLLLRSGEIRTLLLICPKPLVSNWLREFASWAPELPVGVIEGDQMRRRWQWTQPNLPVKIANYELLLRDADLFQDKRLRFDLVLLDEAQRIKNRSSTTSQVVRSISRTRSWALTGTPIENSPEDLVSIFDFLMPGHLNSNMRARRIGQAASDYVLRRTKDKVLTDLPPKLYRDAELDLSSQQWEAYRTAEDEGVVQLSGMGHSLTIQHVFELVLRLKQICNFDPASGVSSKMERLQADLEEVAASGKKAIVFSQWVKTLEMISGRLPSFRPLQYHGKIPARKRDAIIDQFRNDRSHHLLLMSYGAGSVGLNLQFCGYVFLFDRWWNPAVEDQAINRAHRIGSHGPVTVTRMLMLNTIEQRIHQVLEEKRQLFDTVFSETECPTNLHLTQEDVFGLFNLTVPSANKKRVA